MSVTTCPPASPLTADQCRGRHSTCWSVGVPDLDCPDWGLCCFDGCANTCAGSSPPPPPPLPSYEPPAPRRNPCDPNPCGPGSMCIPQEGEPTCKCPEGMVPINGYSADQGCTVPNPCDPNPCGRDAMCIPQVRLDTSLFIVTMRDKWNMKLCYEHSLIFTILGRKTILQMSRRLGTRPNTRDTVFSCQPM